MIYKKVYSITFSYKNIEKQTSVKQEKNSPMAQEQNLLISGPAGVLEARWQPAQQTRLGVLMCHPHPLFHGSMDNKVVTTVTRTLAGRGLPTLRFNFRGVGNSE